MIKVKKRVLLLIAALLCLALLAGCNSLVRTEVGFDTNSLSKAQEIVVYDAAGNEKAVLTEKADIDAFVDAVAISGWKFEKELPEGLTDAGSFTIWQKDTIKALIGGEAAELNEICTFRVYGGGDCLTIETVLIDISFSIPPAAAEYLRNLAA